MEFLILGLSSNATKQDAERALTEIVMKYNESLANTDRERDMSKVIMCWSKAAYEQLCANIEAEDHEIASNTTYLTKLQPRRTFQGLHTIF